MVIYQRPSGNTIELEDTPNMRQLAADNGWTEVKPKKKKKA